METIKINPSLSTEAKFAQSGLSVMDFNINEICKKMTLFMNVREDSKAMEKAVDCSVIRFSLEYSLFGDKSRVGDGLVDEILEAIREPGAGRPFASFQRSEITPAGLATDLFGRLQEIAAPTLLVHGALDRAVPVEGAILAGEKIPDCEVYLMEGCKHWPQKERPQEFARVLQAYLGRRL